jgi:hypothetical protein
MILLGILERSLVFLGIYTESTMKKIMIEKEGMVW